MRAELLLELVSKIRAEIGIIKPMALLQALEKAIQAQVDAPSVDAQNAVLKAKNNLVEILGKAESNSYPPSWRRLLEISAVQQFVGVGLSNRVKSALETVGATPVEALTAIKAIIEQQKSFNTNSVGLKNGLEYFEIEIDTLSPGEFEVVVAIPAQAVDRELKKFGREVQELNNILSTFEEIATGSREPIKIRAIASSDLTLFLDSPYAAAALIAASIERIAKFYSQVQGIVKSHRELKAAKVPTPLLDQLKEFVATKMTESVNEIAADIMAKRTVSDDQARTNELMIELKRSLMEIARRLDQGYSFDVRGNPPEPPTEGQIDTPVTARQRASAKIVREARPALQSFEPADEPILMFPKVGE